MAWGNPRRMKFTITASKGTKILETKETYSGTESWQIYDKLEEKYKGKADITFTTGFSN